MPDETGTETTRSDAPGADDNLFGDAPETAAAEAADEQDAGRETAQDGQGADAAADKTADGPQGSEDAEADAPQEGLKVVVSIKGGRATIGVQQPSSDPHIETFDGLDESGLTQEVPAVIERARARWEETPKHPAYARPAPPARRRNRRQQGAAAEAAPETETEQTQQQTLRLF